MLRSRGVCRSRIISSVQNIQATIGNLRKIAEAGLAGMAMTQSDPMAVPFGGAEVYYGTNPLG